MILRLARHIFPVLLIVGSAQAAPNPKPLDRATAMKAPVSVLARAALTSAAQQFVEVERPDYSGLLGPHAPLGGIHLATKPEQAGYPGLCRATTAWVGISSSAFPIETSTVYKIADDMAPLPNKWNTTYEAALKRKCAHAGRVIRRKTSDFGELTFFEVSKGSEDYVWLASRALQLAIAKAKSGSVVTCVQQPGIDPEMLKDTSATDPEVVEDRENREGCAAPSATLASLQLQRILAMDFYPCPGAREGEHCVLVSFLRRAYLNHQVLWQVTLKFEEGEGDKPDILLIDAPRLRPGFTVYD